MSTTRTLERAAINAHRLTWTWDRFWQMHEENIRKAEPVNRGRYHRLVRRLMALVCSGQEPAGDALEPWEADDVAKPADVGTTACCTLWEQDETPPPLGSLPDATSEASNPAHRRFRPRQPNFQNTIPSPPGVRP